MATSFTYNRADERLAGACSGTVDATYDVDWLVDGRTSYPARYTASGVAWTITGTAQEVGLMVLGNHFLDAALVASISGDITDTVTVPTYGKNGIPFNAYKLITPVSSVDSVTITITGNTGSAVIIGEAIFGKARTLPGTLSRHTGFKRNTFKTKRPIDRAAIRPYDKGMIGIQWSGTLLLTSSQRDDLLAWEESQRNDTLPSVVVIDSKALIGYVEVGNQIPVGSLWKIDVQFVELPRTRW